MLTGRHNAGWGRQQNPEITQPPVRKSDERWILNKHIRIKNIQSITNKSLISWNAQLLGCNVQNWMLNREKNKRTVDRDQNMIWSGKKWGHVQLIQLPVCTEIWKERENMRVQFCIIEGSWVRLRVQIFSQRRKHNGNEKKPLQTVGMTISEKNQ